MSASWWRLDVADGAARLEIVGTIGDDYVELVERIDQLDVERFDVYIDSGGGNAAAGLALMFVIAQHPARIDVQIGRRANSAASLIALAGDRRRIHWSGVISVHETRPADDTQEEPAGRLGDLDGPVAVFYALRTGGSNDDGVTFGHRAAFWRAAMAGERTFVAAECPAVGLVDEIGGDWLGPFLDGRDLDDEAVAEVTDAIDDAIDDAIGDR